MGAGILTIFSLLKTGLTVTTFPAVTKRLGHEDKKQGLFVEQEKDVAHRDWGKRGASVQ